MTDLCNFIQMFMTFWSIFEPTVMPYITSALKEMWCNLFTYLSRKQLYKLISKYNKCRVVIDKKLTTIYTKTDGTCGITKTDRLDNIPNLKTAVSGIPIIVNARKVDLDKNEGETKSTIKEEGYFGTGKNGELYNAWHGFLGIRHNKLVYVAMKCDFEQMCWALVALGIYDAIKLDGGGSFILKNGEILKTTDENRRIHNIGLWM